MLETPRIAAVLAKSVSMTIRRCGQSAGKAECASSVSDPRFGSHALEILEHSANPQRPYASQPPSDRRPKIWSEPQGDMGNSSEIPCRVSSDLHEWRNDLATVSTRDPAKLQYE